MHGRTRERVSGIHPRIGFRGRPGCCDLTPDLRACDRDGAIYMKSTRSLLQAFFSPDYGVEMRWQKAMSDTQGGCSSPRECNHTVSGDWIPSPLASS